VGNEVGHEEGKWNGWTQKGGTGVTEAVRVKGVISQAGSRVEGGGGLPRRTKWRKCRVSNLRVAKL
jgi:hypothetical protein